MNKLMSGRGCWKYFVK